MLVAGTVQTAATGVLPGSSRRLSLCRLFASRRVGKVPAASVLVLVRSGECSLVLWQGEKPGQARGGPGQRARMARAWQACARPMLLLPWLTLPLLPCSPVQHDTPAGCWGSHVPLQTAYTLALAQQIWRRWLCVAECEPQTCSALCWRPAGGNAPGRRPAPARPRARCRRRRPCAGRSGGTPPETRPAGVTCRCADPLDGLWK